MGTMNLGLGQTAFARRLTTGGLLTLLSFSLLVARVLRVGTLTFAFLGWNLFLAWLAVGLGAASCALWDRKKIAASAPCFVAFFAMFPNTFYLVTDLVHLRHTRGPLWHDFALLFSCAATGVGLALCSLFEVHRRVAARFGRGWGWAVVMAFGLSTGYAIWLGRILRFNSWDLVVTPAKVARSALSPLFAPREHLLAWGMTGLFSALLLVLYIAFQSRHPSARA